MREAVAPGRPQGGGLREDVDRLPEPVKPDEGEQDATEPWPPERRRAFREALHTRRARLLRVSRWIGLLLIATVAVGVVLRLPESWWVPAAGAIALFGLVFRLADWKCPNCGERLGTRRSAGVCLGCGAPLD
jgi:hypothetical protein